MSFYDDASLVFLPSGGAGKDTKAYSIKPTNGDGDFTFSRGSNLTATRVDSNGLIEKGRENLLLQSNSFDTTWYNSSSTETGGQAGYDGTNDAWLLTKTGANGGIRQNNTTSGVQTFSFYAKANASTWVKVNNLGSSVYHQANFDLSNGVLGTITNAIDAKIEDVGSGWYRCITTYDTTLVNIDIRVADSDNVVSGTSGSIYIQDAQLEIGLAATEPIESGATTGLAGILEDSPRFDYSGGASCPSLLLEPSRTNLIEYSEYLSSFSGTATINENSIISPEGVQNAAEVVLSSSGTDSFYKEANVIASSKYTLSFYVKQGSNTNNELAIRDQTNASFIATDVSYTASPTEWKRIDYTFTTPSGCTEVRVYPHRSSSSSVGNGYFYGVQLEEGSYPTSYIPNHSGGSVTREADITSVTSVSDLIGQTEGTIYCEFEYNGAADTGVFNRIIALGTGVTQNRILLAKNDTTAELVAFAVTGGTTQVFQAISGTSIIGHHKVAISYKANEYKIYLDGELEFTDTSASVPATTDVYVGTAEDGTTDNELGGVVKQSIIFKEVLSEDNCKALTTI
jgi:hypothetical protein